jgi:hypothetical protein
MAQVITTPEQRQMVETLIEIFTKQQKGVEDQEGFNVYQDLIQLFTETLETNVFKENIFDTIEEEYEHNMSLL